MRDARMVKSRVPAAQMQRYKQSASPSVVMAGSEALLVVDRRAIPIRIITTIAEDKIDPSFTLIYLSREAGIPSRTDIDGTVRAAPAFVKVPFPLEQVLHAFLPFEQWADMVYGSSEADAGEENGK